METTELIDVLSRGEDSRHQFKADMTNADALAAEIVAFCNTAGGRIFIGVNDDGSVRGLSGADVARLNQLIANGDYSHAPVDQAFMRLHEEPGRSWNIEEWNKFRNARKL